MSYHLIYTATILEVLVGCNRIANTSVNNNYGGIFHDDINVLPTSYWENAGSLSSDEWACSTYCNYSYLEISTNKGSGWGCFRNHATGCDSYVTGSCSSGVAVCSAHKYYSFTSGSPSTLNMHKYAPCYSEYSHVGGTASCPLGWGTYESYASFSPGCCNGANYPYATPEYSGPSLYVGSQP